MPVESAADRAVFFNADEFGTAASYSPPGGGAAQVCTVLRSRRDRETGFGPAMMQANTITVRKSELAAPAKNGVFSIDGESLTIIDDPRCDDPDRLLWSMTVQ